MPHIIVKLWPGEQEPQKRKLAEEITKAVMDTLCCGEGAISVGIEEVAGKDWMAKVYAPDLQTKPSTIYKMPGYKSV